MPTELKQDKDPQDIDDFFWEWKTRLAASETITGFTATVEAGTWTVVDTGIAGTQTVVRMAGGTAGTVCSVIGRITTSTGRELDWTIVVNIAQQ
jgi:hypothetical protein